MILRIDDVKVNFRSADILKGVSFAVAQGENVALIGPNGAGKTTILRAILGVLASFEGRISINGQDNQTLSPREIARVVGYVPQRLVLPFPYSVQEFVMMNRYAAEPSVWPLCSPDHHAIDEIMKITDISNLAARRVSDLSGGELQRVLVAGALVHRPAILLLDEPAASLDPKYSRALHRLLTELQAVYPLTILAVSHDLNAAIRHSSRVIALKNGLIFFDGTPRELSKVGILESLYDVEFERAVVSDQSCVVIPKV